MSNILLLLCLSGKSTVSWKSGFLTSGSIAELRLEIPPFYIRVESYKVCKGEISTIALKKLKLLIKYLKLLLESR